MNRRAFKQQDWIFFSGILLNLFFASQVMALPADLETGRDIFYKHCKACHGDKGDGKTFAANVLNPPPKNFTAEISKKELTEKRMTNSVTKGRKGTAMMPWESNLTQEEIRAVVIYIRQKLMKLKPPKNADKH
ncbi:MAG: cytochrome c [Nitrospina sp.]|nr:cytochrome c [Nitrospina sp.]MBT3875351.1 cytochrome c [Nitrospina sp.]MBT4558992.1 cytochrome c [Nitrospina sp.]MBT6738667.1 cytochrome c [Nitrospina sp.]MBT7709979.1 cytochrome c [Nitrospina sp.]